MKTIEESINAVQSFDFKSATQKEIEEILPTFGMNDEYPYEMPNFLKPYMGWGIKFWQYPNQFSKLLTFLKNKDIGSYLELGVRWGGTFIIINELLQKYDPILEAHAVDIIPQSEILEAYQKKRYLDFKYHLMDSQSPFLISSIDGDDFMLPQKKIDLVFIDGCHAYQCVKRDYFLALMLGAKYIIFHDIVNINTKGLQYSWREAKLNHKKTYEFVDQYDINGKMLGIGVVEVSKEDDVFPLFKPYYHHLFNW